MSPTAKISGCPGTVQVRVDQDPAGPVGLRPGRLGQLAGQRRRGHPGRPHLGHRRDALAPALGLHVDAGGVHADHLGLQLDLDAEQVQLAQRPGGQVVAERAEHRAERVDQDHPGLARVDVLVLPGQRAVGQLGDLPGHLHAGRRRRRPPRRSASGRSSAGSVCRSASSNAPKIRARSSRASSMLFMPGAKSANSSLPKYDWEAPAATISVSYSHRVVDAGRRPPTTVLASTSTPVTVPSRTSTLSCRAQHLADRRGDLALGEDAGRHLVEQRLEQVVRGAVDQRDLDRRAPQRLGGEQPAEPRSDDHHAVHLRSP